MALEVAVIALVYVVLAVVVKVILPPPSGLQGLARVFLVHLLAVLPVAAFMWSADGTWWSVCGTAVVVLSGLQTLVPRLETALERQSPLGTLPVAVVAAAFAASVAVGIFCAMLPDEDGLSGEPPFFWQVGGPVAYLWRLLALAAAYAVVHVGMMRLGRMIFGQTGRSALPTELGHRLTCGLVVVVALWMVAVHLPGLDLRTAAILASISAVVCLAGRWSVVVGWPSDMALTRLALRAVADVAVGCLAVWLLLPRPGDGEGAPALPIAADSAPLAGEAGPLG